LNKQHYAFFLKKNRPRNKQNPMAEELSDGRYRQRVIKNKKKYERKIHKISRRDRERAMSDLS
jgi:hypothetical protein|tara:strand:- start:256 stop:444 length:189 start_codon:yes stop_codon:yes gene_type:complete